FDHPIFFGRLIVRHHDHAAIAASVANMREANPRVAGGALDHGSAGLERAAAFGVQYDPLGRPIFDRTAGIHEFRLAEDFAAGLIAEPAQANQGSGADRAGKPVTDPHHGLAAASRP